MKTSVLRILTQYILKPKIPLSASIQHDKIEDVKIAINLKVDLNFHQLYSEDSFIYPLMASIYFEKYDICKLILNGGNADPNYQYSSFKNQRRGIFLSPTKKRARQDNDDIIGSSAAPQFMVFYDPLKRISNQKIPPEIEVDLERWNKITPTVLSFVMGNEKLLELCFRKGGRLYQNFDRDGSLPLMWYFLEHPSTCQTKICKLLIDYRELVINRDEQEAFSEFCAKFSIMKSNINMSVDLAEEIDKIIVMLIDYGYRKRESKKLKLIPRRNNYSDNNNNTDFFDILSNTDVEEEEEEEKEEEEDDFSHFIRNKNRHYHQEKKRRIGRKRSLSNPLVLDITINTHSSPKKNNNRSSVTLSLSESEDPSEYYLSTTNSQIWGESSCGEGGSSYEYQHQQKQQLQQEEEEEQDNNITYFSSGGDSSRPSSCDTSPIKKKREMFSKNLNGGSGGTMTPFRYKRPKTRNKKYNDLLRDEDIVNRSIIQRRRRKIKRRRKPSSFFLSEGDGCPSTI